MATATKKKDAEETQKPEVEDMESVLDISTLAPVRPHITIRTEKNPDGSLFELKTMDDFGIEEQQQLTRNGAEFDRLWNTDDLNSAGRKRMKMLLDKMFERVLDAPADVKKLLSDGQRSQVVLAFTLAPLAQQAAREQRDQEARTSSTTAS